MHLVISRSMSKEHEELHSELKRGVREKGTVGEAARVVGEVLLPHSLKEEEYAMWPLGLPSNLAESNLSVKMKEALAMTNALEADLDRMLKENKETVPPWRNQLPL